MRLFTIATLTAIALAQPASFAMAGNDKGKGKGAKAQNTEVLHLAKNSKKCPPGLAKKRNGCNPPGQVKNRFNVGDRIFDDFLILNRPGRFGLDPDETYFRVGDFVYRVDRETREVLDLIGAAVQVLD